MGWLSALTCGLCSASKGLSRGKPSKNVLPNCQASEQSIFDLGGPEKPGDQAKSRESSPDPEEPEQHQFLTKGRTTLSQSSWSSKREARSNRKLSNESLSSLANKKTRRSTARKLSEETISSLSEITKFRSIVRTLTNGSDAMSSDEEDISLLHKNLKAQMVLYEDDPNRYFLPENVLEEILSEQNVRAALEEHDFKVDINELSSFVCRRARRLFATLAWSGAEILIERFYDMDFGDEYLPVGFKKKIFTFGNSTTPEKHPFSSKKLWTERTLRSFCNDDQWPFLAPVFEDHQFRYSFPDRCRMPFVEEDPRSVKESYFSIVEERYVHHAHLKKIRSIRTKIGSKEHIRVAIKELRKGTMTLEEFAQIARMEAETLEMLRDLAHPHLIQAIAYYTIGPKHYVMFPWAERGNLRDIWNRNPPTLTEEYLKWVFSQMCGLAEGIKELHDSNGQKHWRHGDLKPENILCFEGEAGGDMSCTLVISDVGLSKDHDKLTAARWEATRTIPGTLMYQPPEARMQSKEPRSRRYDVWSLGCIYLEFVIWLLYGSQGLDEFDQNLKRGENTRLYVIDNSQTARLNNEVQNTIDHIRMDPRCPKNTAISRLVDLIVNRLLVPETRVPETQKLGLDRVDSGFTKPDSPHSSAPAIRLQSATFRPEDFDSLSINGRATAQELYDAMERIRIDVAVGTLEWMQWNAPVPNQKSQRQYANNLAASDASAHLGRSKEIENDYRFTPLDDNWEYMPDTELAQHLFSDPSQRESFSQASSESANLCQRCRNLQLGRPAYSFTDTMSGLYHKSRYCDLCSLLLHRVQAIQKGHDGHVQFQRAGSSLIFNQNVGQPVASLYSVFDSSSSLGAQFSPDDIQPGLPTLPTAGSATHIKILEKWLRSCDKAHTCYPEEDSFLPTRVLEVGDVDSPTVRLTEDVQSQTRPGKYIALSHRWGPPEKHKTFRTLRTNKREFQKQIEVKELPQTFRDAVDITRKLGIQYLWIDSLCIVQDDKDDWNTESRLMEQVFSSAYVTIAASCASGTTDGFLKPRPPEKMLDVDQGELNKRGWVLQERALSRRTIYFTEKQSYWECGGGVRCETLTKMKNRKASFLGDSNFPHAVEAYVKGMKIEFFQNIYERYSKLQLSYQTDRPIAIKGLERRLIRTLRTVGGYGVFERYLYRSLLWRRSDDSIARIRFENGTCIPTWSWMAYDGGIEYLKVPFGKVAWKNTEIVSPFKKDEDGARNAEDLDMPLEIGARAWDVLDALDVDAERIYLDEPGRSLASAYKCIVVGVEKEAEERPEQRHYVMLVCCVGEGQGEGDVYERVGVGVLERRDIVFEGTGEMVRIR